MSRRNLLALAASSYEQDVLPIFTKYCFTCHGQSSPTLGLELRTAAGALRRSHNGPVIVKGNPAESLLWAKVSTRQMPNGPPVMVAAKATVAPVPAAQLPPGTKRNVKD